MALTQEQRERAADTDSALMPRIETIAYQLELIHNEAEFGLFEEDGITKTEKQAAVAALQCVADWAARAIEALQ